MLDIKQQWNWLNILNFILRTVVKYKVILPTFIYSLLINIRWDSKKHNQYKLFRYYIKCSVDYILRLRNTVRCKFNTTVRNHKYRNYMQYVLYKKDPPYIQPYKITLQHNHPRTHSAF